MPSGPDANELLAAIYARGDALRRRRLRWRSGVGALVAVALLAVPAVVRGDAEQTVHMTDDPVSSTTSTDGGGEDPTTSTVVDEGDASTTSTAPAETTTTASCRNAFNRPECGPFFWDPEPAPNQPPKVTVVSVTPSSPTAGDEVTVRIELEDAESGFLAISCENTQEWGDGTETAGDGTLEGRCYGLPPDCGFDERNGPHDPPEPQPSSFTVDLRHRYDTPGTYTARLTFRSGHSCYAPYIEEATIEVTISVAPPSTTTRPLLTP